MNGSDRKCSGRVPSSLTTDNFFKLNEDSVFNQLTIIIYCIMRTHTTCSGG